MHLLLRADSRLCSGNHGPIGQALCNPELISAPKPGEEPDPAAQPRPPQVSRGPALVLQALQVSRQKPAGSAVQAYCCRYARFCPKRLNYSYSSQGINKQDCSLQHYSVSNVPYVGTVCHILSALHVVKSCLQALIEVKSAACVTNALKKQHLLTDILHLLADIPEWNPISQPPVGPQEH